MLSTLNTIFAWCIVVFSIFGYIFTIRKIGERWMFWLILGSCWFIFAIVLTITGASSQNDSPFVITVWIFSYILIVISIVLIIMRYLDFKKRKYNPEILIP